MVEIAEVLINAGVSVNEVDNDGVSPLQRAVQQFQNVIKLVSLLIDKGAIINRNSEKSPFIELPLTCASGRGKMIALLIRNGADVNEKNRFNGETALHVACMSYNAKEEIFSLLVESGADISVKNRHGETPFAPVIRSIHKFNPSLPWRLRALHAMVKEFTKLIFENVTIDKGDMDLIMTTAVARRHFEQCMRELNQMKSTKFYGNYSYYFVFSKKLKSVNNAYLINNERFLSNFEAGLFRFAHFKSDLQNILKETIKIRKKANVGYSILYAKLQDLFPDTVVRNLAKNLTLKEIQLSESQPTMLRSMYYSIKKFLVK